MRLRLLPILTSALLLACCLLSGQEPSATSAPAGREVVLRAADVGDKLFPDKVFFRGQSATVQGRNSGGVQYGDGFLVLAALVDNSGYSTGIKEKYQGFLITEVPIEIGGQTVKPGQYGFGFVEGNNFVLMDVGAHDLLKAPSTKDTELKRPVPLQVVSGSQAGKYRLYKGRDWVEFQRVK
jgi:hypothetical protein